MKFHSPIIPYWSEIDRPEFIARTETEYVRIPHSAITERGLTNRMFDSLIAGLPDGCVIAGGFMTNLMLDEKNAKDIDIFCLNEKAFMDVCNLISNPPAKSENEDDKIWAYRNYTTALNFEAFYKANKEHRFVKFTSEKKELSIQVMKMYWYSCPQHVIDTFDLTIAQVASDKEYIYMNPLTQLDLAKKRLVLHRMQFPASTIRRIIKYASKGFYACPGSLVNISKAIQAHTAINDPDELQFVYLD